MGKMMALLVGMAVMTTILGGCTLPSQRDERSNIDFGSIDTNMQCVEAQNGTTIDIKEPENLTVSIDEKLDENLFISAELKMPENNLYEYTTQLKIFDYDKVYEAIGQNAEGVLAVSDGLAGGSLTYQRNDMAAHLETYCSYSAEMGLTNEKNLSFMSQADAVARIQRLIEMLEVGGEPEVLNIVAMNQSDFENVKMTIMEDDSYQGVLSAKGYERDMFDEDMEVYRIIFRMDINGIPVYRNEPTLRGTSERFLAYPVTITALLSNNGIELITMMGMFEAYDGHQKEAAIIGRDGIKDAIMKKFGDVILTSEYRAANIWMEYFPLLREDSFTEIDLIPVWCVDFEIDGESVEDTGYTIRFNAITGEEIS